MTARLTGRPQASNHECVDLRARLTSKEPLPAGPHVSVLWGNGFEAVLLDTEGVGRLPDFHLDGALQAE